MSLMNKLSQLAKSQQGKDLVEKAKTIANDPKTREKIDEARTKFSGHVDTAKQKMAEKKAKDEGSSAGNGAPLYGEETSAANTPQYGEPDTSHAQLATGATGAAETATYGEPGPADTPTYGEPTATDTPQYGEPDTAHAQPVTGATGAAETATYGEPGPAATPTYGEEGAAGTPPTTPHEDPIDKTNPTYGEEEGDKPLYGEDGPKAA